ncbi:MAG: asparagine synthase-related protein [Spirochaetota bacterium]
MIGITDGNDVTKKKGSSTQRVSSRMIGSMLKDIRHRGPDTTMIRQCSAGAVGYAGIQLSSYKSTGFSCGKEPIVCIDGALIRDDADNDLSDADYVRKLYMTNGKKGLGMLEGSFACAVIDGEESILARDPVGARPLVYNLSPEGRFAFASEAKALRTLAESVEELPPGHYYTPKDGLKPLEAAVPPRTYDCSTMDKAVKTVRETVVEAVKQAMESGDIGGVALSGGLDSSIILAVAHEFNKDLEVFSTTLAEHPGEDLKYAKMMVDYLGLKHHIYGITQKDIEQIIPEAVWYLESFDEDCISGFIANYYTSRMASERVNSILVGEGADELFGGYFRELKDIPDPEEKERIGRKLVDVAYNTALRRLDRAWMANSVEYFAPFLAPSVVAASQAIPMDFKVYGEDSPIEKWVLREAFRDMLPAEIADRPKLRFARGVGVDNLMDKAVEKKVDEKAFLDNPVSKSGIPLFSAKELWYYQLFQQYFPQGYEELTARWDPFK